jgi:ribonuclease VapC
MIVDASALVAIVRKEPEADAFSFAIGRAKKPQMSAPTLFEASIVLDGQGSAEVSQRMDDVLDTLNLEIIPFTSAHAELARLAYQRFGKGSGHKAKLNFGDCMAYATAVDRGEPLLFKGNDFVHTDVKPAL